MSEFQITYKGSATDGGFDMAIVGESMVGFNSLFKDFYKACGIDGELQIRTTSVQQGSVIITGLLVAEITARIIEDPELFIQGLRLVDDAMWRQVSDFLSAIGNADKSINNFFEERQFTASIIAGIVSGVVAGLVVWWFENRKKKDLAVTDNSRLGKKLGFLRQKKRFNRALKPLCENGYDSIALSVGDTVQRRQVVVDDVDLEYILPEDDKILPEYENGLCFNAEATIKSLSSSHGERVGLTFFDNQFGNRTYTAYPDDGHTSASYRDLYGETVTGEFEVYRKSLYKIPEFKICSMEKLQGEMFAEDVN